MADQKSTSKQKNSMAKNEFYQKWNREHDKQREKEKERRDK